MAGPLPTACRTLRWPRSPLSFLASAGGTPAAGRLDSCPRPGCPASTKGRQPFACSINFNLRHRPVHLPHRPPRSAGPLRRRLLRRRLRADALDVRGHHGADRRGRDRQVARCSRSRDNAVILDVGFKSEGSRSARRVQGPPRSSRRATKSKSSSSTSRTRKARSSSRRRRPTSCASGRRSASPTRTISRSKARWSRRSRAAWSSTSWASTRSSPARRSRSAACRTSTSCSARRYEFKIIKLNKRRRNIVVSAAA